MRPPGSSLLYVALGIVAWSFAALGMSAQAPTPVQDMNHPQGTNAAIFNFTGSCANCHDNRGDGAPSRYMMGARTPEEVLDKMSSGLHAEYAKALTEFQKRIIAVYVGGRPLGAAATGDASTMKNRCAAAPPFEPFTGSEWNGWAIDATNSRFQTNGGLTAADVPRLTLKWAFGFPFGNSAYSQPAVVGGRVFVGSDTGFIYSLDTRTGCVYWSFRADAGVRTSMTLGPGATAGTALVYFGDIRANVYAVNAQSGALVWKERLDTHPVSRVTGSPTLAQGRLYVPLSSLEVSGAGNPVYPCCTFRGGVAAYDALTGKQIWKSYSIAREPRPTKVTSKGTQLWAPSGAGVWAAPTVDLKRRAVYIGTGNGYTEPADEASDSVVAFDIDTGKRLWFTQVLPQDAYIRDCPGKYRPNVPTENKSETCPEELGPDWDLATSPLLRTAADGKSYILVGQKSGHAWGLDPDRNGAIVWSRQLGLGWENGGGGIVWGFAADDRFAYFSITRAHERLGLAAVHINTGEVAWRARPPIGGSAPAAVLRDVIFQASSTGTLWAFSSENGRGLWNFDTAREFQTVNGVAAKGGNIVSAGPVVAGGMVFVASGYSDLGGGNRGNVLLAFGVDAKQ